MNQLSKLISADEVGIEDILPLLQEYWKFLIKYKYVPVLLAIISATILGYQAYQIKPQYPARLSFMVTKDDGPGGIGGLASLLGGFNLGGGNKESALEKVLQLFYTQRIVKSSLFQEIEVNDRNDFLANHMIELYGTTELLRPYIGLFGNKRSWITQVENITNFRFTHRNDSLFTEEESIFLKIIYDKVAGNPALEIKPMINSSIDEKSGIMQISISSENELVSFHFINVLYDQLGQYYIDKTIEKQEKIYDIISYKKDSLSIELSKADLALAKFEDENRNLIWLRGELRKVNLQRNARVTEVLYTEMVRQLESADFALRQKTPYVQEIDVPALPLNRMKPSWLSAAFKGGVVGLLFAIFICLLVKFLMDLNGVLRTIVK